MGAINHQFLTGAKLYLTQNLLFRKRKSVNARKKKSSKKTNRKGRLVRGEGEQEEQRLTQAGSAPVSSLRN